MPLCNAEIPGDPPTYCARRTVKGLGACWEHTRVQIHTEQDPDAWHDAWVDRQMEARDG